MVCKLIGSSHLIWPMRFGVGSSEFIALSVKNATGTINALASPVHSPPPIVPTSALRYGCTIKLMSLDDCKHCGQVKSLSIGSGSHTWCKGEQVPQVT